LNEVLEKAANMESSNIEFSSYCGVLKSNYDSLESSLVGMLNASKPYVLSRFGNYYWFYYTAGVLYANTLFFLEAC